jgi:hypothetical protein
MIHTILSIILVIPKAVDAVTKIASCLNEALDTYNKKEKLKEFDKNIEKAKKTKDTSGLDAMFDDRKKKK